MPLQRLIALSGAFGEPSNAEHSLSVTGYAKLCRQRADQGSQMDITSRSK